MALSSSLEKAVWSVDRELPVARLSAMTDVVAHSEMRRQFTVTLLAIFACGALLLAALGLYGVMSYIVSQRTREFGLRIALGAQPRDVLRMVLGYGLRLTLAGLGCGLIVALVSAQLMRGLLFGVKPTDPATFVATALLLGGTALLASYLPALKATRVDPMIALREE
jgi:ABC-type antimicrobial peptide transport system permease subunit